jgi:hypothetical protein
MKPNIQPSPHPQEGHGTGWFRDKIASVLLGVPTREQSRAEFSALQPLFDHISEPRTLYADTIRTALSSYPGISASLNELYDSSLDMQELLEVVLRLNEQFGSAPEHRQGKSQEAWFDLPNGAKLRIRMHPDDGTLTFTMKGSMKDPVAKA